MKATKAAHASGSPSADWTFNCEVAGKSVLVVTSDPSLSLKALSRGAREVVVVDVDPHRVREARAQAESLALRVKFQCMNIEDEGPSALFDVVLCVDVLQRVRNPMQVIDYLIAACRETLVIEVPGPAGAEAQKYLREISVPRWQRFILARLPVILVGRNGTTPKHQESKFYFSLAALRNVLTRHRWHFDDVLGEEETIDGRIRVTATRRARVQKLIVVAGPSGSGKSSLIRRLEKEDVPEISLRLGIEDIASWQVATASDFPFGPTTNAMIVHYDFLRPWRRSARIYDRDETLELLRLADEIVFVTVWAEPELLRKRVRDRIALLTPTRDKPLRRKLQVLLGVFQWANPRRATFQKAKNILNAAHSTAELEMIHLGDHERIAELYQQPDKLMDLYRGWFAFCGKFAARAHWIADTSRSDTQLVPLAEWTEKEHNPLSASNGIAFGQR